MRNGDVGFHVSTPAAGGPGAAPGPPPMRGSVSGPRRPARRVRVLHVINSFEHGGAETMLCNLLLRADRTRFDPSVVALIHNLAIADPILRAGIPVVTMGMRAGVPDPRGISRLARHVRRLRPDVVQCWMDHSNLVGGLAARMASRAPVVWGVHHSDHFAAAAKRSTVLTVSACAGLSHYLPARVVCCSEHGRRLYRGMGFAAAKLAVIPNGFDADVFRPDPAARAAVRSELGLTEGTPLVGIAARYDPLKDHATFLAAAALLAGKRPDAHFVLCGTGVDRKNAALAGTADSLGIAGRCHLLGPRRDVARIFAALDLAASSSVSEAFPLAVGEAMSCCVPCVATDVGDCALIIGDTGRIVPPRDPAAMAAAWAEVLDMAPPARQALGRAARRRVVERFELGAVTRRYEALYAELARGVRAPAEVGGETAGEPAGKPAGDRRGDECP